MYRRASFRGNYVTDSREIRHAGKIGWAAENLACRGEHAACSRRPRLDRRLPLHTFAADRLPLPPSADLFGLFRSGVCPIRLLGRRLDDLGAPLPMPSVRDLRAGFRACRAPCARPLVDALAIRAVARDARRRVTLSRCTHATTKREFCGWRFIFPMLRRPGFGFEDAGCALGFPLFRPSEEEWSAGRRQGLARPLVGLS